MEREKIIQELQKHDSTILDFPTVVPGDPVLTEVTAPDGSMHSLSGNTRLQRWQNCLPDPGRDMTWQKTWGLPIQVLT